MGDRSDVAKHWLGNQLAALTFSVPAVRYRAMREISGSGVVESSEAALCLLSFLEIEAAAPWKEQGDDERREAVDAALEAFAAFIGYCIFAFVSLHTAVSSGATTALRFSRQTDSCVVALCLQHKLLKSPSGAIEARASSSIKRKCSRCSGGVGVDDLGDEKPFSRATTRCSSRSQASGSNARVIVGANARVAVKTLAVRNNPRRRGRGFGLGSRWVAAASELALPRRRALLGRTRNGVASLLA